MTTHEIMINLCNAEHPQHPEVSCFRLPNHDQNNFRLNSNIHMGWDESILTTLFWTAEEVSEG